MSVIEKEKLQDVGPSPPNQTSEVFVNQAAAECKQACFKVDGTLSCQKKFENYLETFNAASNLLPTQFIFKPVDY